MDKALLSTLGSPIFHETLAVRRMPGRTQPHIQGRAKTMGIDPGDKPIPDQIPDPSTPSPSTCRGEASQNIVPRLSYIPAWAGCSEAAWQNQKQGHYDHLRLDENLQSQNKDSNLGWFNSDPSLGGFSLASCRPEPQKPSAFAPKVPLGHKHHLFSLLSLCPTKNHWIRM